MSKANIVLWDIETTGLEADWDHVLCVGYKRLDGTRIFCPSVHNQEDVTDDKPVLEAVYDVLADADMWITHNGKAFDLPYMNARLLYHGMKPLPRGIAHVDTYHSIAKNSLKLSSRRLGALADFFELEEQKESLSRAEWRRAKRGNRTAIENIARYCCQDIRTLEAVYHKIKPLCPTHPNLGLVTPTDRPACPICNEEGSLQKRGKLVKQAAVWQRYQCQSCGGWSSAPTKGSRAIR